MKYFLLILVSFSMAIVVKAQKMSNAEIQQKMKMAQQKMDSIKKAHPEYANMLNQVNVQQQYQNLNDRVTQNQQKLAQYKALNQVPIPHSNASAQVASLPALTSAQVQNICKNLTTKIEPKIDAATKAYIDQKAKDTRVNLAALGTLLSVFGFPKSVGDYMICKGVLANPNDYLSLNDLGICLKEEGDMENAIRCLKYALQLNDSSCSVLTNLGWVSAYYGDFSAAKQYFDQALSINKNFINAIEGKSILEYANGNKKAVKTALQQEMMIMAAGGGSGSPSEPFIKACAGVMQDENSVNMDHQEDPNNDHTFDNNGNDEENQDPPPGANVESILYPSFKPIFPNSFRDLLPASSAIYPFKKRGLEEVKRLQQTLKSHMESLAAHPLVPIPTSDDQGNVVVPHSYAKFYELLELNHQLFQRRIYWYKKKFTEKLPSLVNMIPQRDQDLLMEYMKKLGDCEAVYEQTTKGCKDNTACLEKAEADRKKCVDAVKCEYIPRIRGVKNNDIGVVGAAWSDFFDQVMNTINWYIKVSSPLISRIHDPQWNEHANMLRETDIRIAVLDAYDKWTDALHPVAANGALIQIALEDPPECKIPMPTMGDGPDPFSKKHDKLKTFAGPCYTVPISFDLIVAQYEDNCDHTKYTIAGGPLKGYLEQIHHNKFVEDKDDWKVGGSVKLSAGPSIKEQFGNLELSTGAKAGVEVESSSTFNSNFQRISKSGSIDISVEAGAEAAGKGLAGDLSKGVSLGGDLKVEYTTGLSGTTTTVSADGTFTGKDLLK